MTTLFVLFALSCGLGLLLTRQARERARRWGLVDQPDGRRKIHKGAIPVAGGPAVLLSTFLALCGLAAFSNPLQARVLDAAWPLTGLLLAGLLVCGVGVLDDLRGLRGRHKLLAQVVAVSIIMAFGIVVRHVSVFGFTIDLGLLAIPFTAFWLLGAINSLNLIDGMDGMLGSLGLIICMAMAAMAVLGQHWAMAALAVALSGSLLGFLRYNFPPATIFLGDSGSMLIGLAVGFLGIQCSLKGPATIALAAPVALMTIPILDTFLAITRRKLTGRSIYATDRGHLHHCLLRQGLSHRRALMLVAVLSLVTVVGTLVSLLLKNELVAVLSGVAVVAMLVVTRVFGHAELLLVMNRVWSTAASFLRLRPGGHGRSSEVRLQGTAGWNELWRSLLTWAQPLNVRRMRLDVNAPALHEGYHASWDHPDLDPDDPNLWLTAMPFAVDGQYVGRLELVGYKDEAPVAHYLITVTKLMEDFERALGNLSEELSASRQEGGANPDSSNGFPAVIGPSRVGSAVADRDECLTS